MPTVDYSVPLLSVILATPDSLQTLTDAEIEARVRYLHGIGSLINLLTPYNDHTFLAFMRLFRCQRCGMCCKGGLGIALKPDEVGKMATKKGLSLHQFKDQYTCTDNGRRIMSAPCSFQAADNRCTIRFDRPYMCRVYPICDPIRTMGTGTELDGQYLMAADSRCPEARRVSVFILKAVRDRLKRGR